MSLTKVISARRQFNDAYCSSFGWYKSYSIVPYKRQINYIYFTSASKIHKCDAVVKPRLRGAHQVEVLFGVKTLGSSFSSRNIV